MPIARYARTIHTGDEPCHDWLPCGGVPTSRTWRFDDGVAVRTEAQAIQARQAALDEREIVLGQPVDMKAKCIRCGNPCRSTFCLACRSDRHKETEEECRLARVRKGRPAGAKNSCGRCGAPCRVKWCLTCKPDVMREQSRDGKRRRAKGVA